MSGRRADRDPAWFEQLYRAHHGAVLAYARRRVDDADDVVAEVFTTAWNARDRVPDLPRPWLLRTARNHILHAYRASGRRTQLAARASVEVRSSADHADEVAGQHDASVAVRAALSRLTPDEQEVLRLSAWEDLRPAELALVIGGTAVAARVRLHRARRRLSAELERIESAHRPNGAPSTLEQTS